MRAETRQLVGVGLYTVSNAARLLQMPSRKIRRWVQGYVYRYAGAKRDSDPVFARALTELEGVLLLSFVDLIELKFVEMFRSEGVLMSVIRAAAREGARLFGTDHPFAVRGFKTDGRAIFATLQDADAEEIGIRAEELVQELHRGQYVFAHMVTPFFRKLEWEAEELRRYWPMGKDYRVVIDPQIAFGQPVDAFTGVPTNALFIAVEGGAAVEDVGSWYDVPRDAVTHAVEYEASLRQAS